jgi:hypothetical protein
MWIQLGLMTASVLAGGGVGYLVRGRRETEMRKREILRRRNANLDRGRASPRRPEHDGEPAARIHRMKIRNERPGPAR